MSFPEVQARVWLSTSGVRVKLLPSFSAFSIAVVNMLVVGPAARLYWFPDERSPISDRQPICDEDTFSAFRGAWSGGLRPIVWAYTPPPPSGDKVSRSPDQLPAAVLPTAATPSRSASSAGTRDSGQQREFRSALEARDGRNLCVACQGAGPVEAAHLLRHRSSPSILASAGLLSAWDIRNGVMLCSDCHLFFDKFFWCVGADGAIAVSEALLSDEEHRSKFLPLAGSALRRKVGDVNWPCDLTWAHHRQLFEAARDERHRQQAGNKFPCDDCGTLFPTSKLWQKHVKSTACEKRIRDGRRQLWTPLERKAFSAIASTGEAADAARQLSMIHENEGEGLASDVRNEGAGEHSDSD